MGRLTHVLLGTLVLTLVVFGGVADRALLEQDRIAQQAALAESDERARLTALSVRAALAQVEQAVLANQPPAGVSAGRLAISSGLSAPRGWFVPYLKRSRDELLALLSSNGLTGSGLPEAVASAVALGSAEAKAQVAERLLSGLLPARPEDVPQLARALGVGPGPRLDSLQERLGRAPGAESLPLAPSFRRALTERGAIEGWTRSEVERRHYEVPVDLLLSRAGVSDRARLSRDPSSPGGEAGRRVVSVPDVEGLRLAVDPERPGRLRLRALRIVLWLAVLASMLGLGAVHRALRREGQAVAREKAFLASVTHELRTPLTAIRLFGETLAEGRGDPREYGAMMARESQRLDTLVERVLAVTRVDEAPSFTRVTPGELVRSALSLVAARAEQRAVTLEWRDSTGEEGLPEATWDAEAVRRALLNLLDNAIKHGKAGGRVEVRAAVEDDGLKLSVTDDGPGIGWRDRKRVFGRFERGGSESAGTGLGLYVVEQVARAHGGRVELVTEENRGCTFTLVLPLVPPGAGTAAVAGRAAT